MSLFVINVHAMKSALANIGEVPLSDDAAKLEAAGRDNNIKFILAELPAFLELLFGVIHKLEAKDEHQGEAAAEEDGTEEGRVFLKEKLLEIQNACAAYEKKTAKAALSELQNKSWSASVKEWLSAISEFILHSDFTEADNTINCYLQNLSEK
jgi:hypothetical protein